jgi:nicotinate (nicotinamide) nucleotide adenylyltransferase
MNEPRWNELVGVFGGAFDPPHLGHREAVESLLRDPGVKSVRILPSGNPPLKTAQTPAEHRLEMTRLNFANLREGLSYRVEIDDREIHRDPARPSYTIDTIRELRRELGTGLAFVVGVDQIESLDRWHRIQELLGLCHWIAIERKSRGDEAESATFGNAEDRMAAGLKRLSALGLIRSTPHPRLWRTAGGTFLLTVPTEARPLSSTEIRRKFARMSPQIIGQIGTESLPTPEDENLHPDVESYLKAHGLYGT